MLPMQAIDNLALAYLVLELKPSFEGAFVNKVSEMDSSTLKLKLHTKQGSKDLVIKENIFFFSPFSVQARHGKSNFAASLKKELYNKRITAIEQHSFDRVVEIKLLEHSLVLELLGDGNKILLGKDGRIISCAKNEKWSEREIHKGFAYVYPDPKSLNPSTLSVKELKEKFSSSQKDAIRSLISCVNISPLIAEEVFFSLGLEKGAKASGLGEKELEKIASGVRAFYAVEQAKLRPVAYKEFAYPFRLLHLKETPVETKSLNDCFGEAFSSSASSSPLQAAGQAKAKGKVSGLEHMKKQQQEARKKFNAQVDENRVKAELIYQHFNEIESLKKEILGAVSKGMKEKYIMYKISSAALAGDKRALLVKKIDLQKKKIELEL